MSKKCETAWINLETIGLTGFGPMAIGFDVDGSWISTPHGCRGTDTDGLNPGEVKQLALRVYDSQSEKTKENLDTILEALG